MVEITVRRGRQFQRPKTNIVQCFVVDTKRFVRVFHQLVNRQCGVIGLHHGVRYLRRWNYAECVHYAVGIFLSDFRYQQGTHAGSRSTAQRVSQLESLQTIAVFGLAAYYVHDRVHQLSTLRVMTFSPVVT